MNVEFVTMSFSGLIGLEARPDRYCRQPESPLRPKREAAFCSRSPDVYDGAQVVVKEGQ